MEMDEFSTPMMQQYLQVKQEYADCLVWFRLGDFYEMFLDDAKIGARILGITLTSRARGKDGRIPMAGIPYHAADNYLARLIKAGYKVAICEQLSEPDGRTLVERKVIRVVTPGTLLDEKNLQRKENNYLLSVSLSSVNALDKKQVVGIAAADISTGEFLSNEFTTHHLQEMETLFYDLFAQLQPTECILSSEAYDSPSLLKMLTKNQKMTIFPFPQWEKWAGRSSASTIKKYFHLSTLHGFSLAHQPQAQEASAALLGYLQETQKTPLVHIQGIKPLLAEEYLHMDRSTIRNLELLTTLRDDQPQGSLLHVIDHTQTAMGGRLLKKWILKPLIDKSAIEARLDAIAFFLEHRELAEQLRHELAEILDVERLISRLSAKVGNPRDVKSIEHSLRIMQTVRSLVREHASNTAQLPAFLSTLVDFIDPEIDQVAELISKTLEEHPPFDPKEGNLIREGVDARLDELRQVVNHSREWMAEQELSERQKTNIASLKIKYNQVFGFYIEVSKANLHLVPSYFERKQTLVNAERFITPELKHHEEIILTAEAEMHRIEYDEFVKLTEHILGKTQSLQHAAHAIAQIDCLLSLVNAAQHNHFERPEIHERGELEISQGRHPVVEQLVEAHHFVPNDVLLDHHAHQLLLITGPNMAGKSVFMRQVALITLLAHMGSYVPAQRARISLTDQIFVRSGAADMITAGLSTFMVEMVETAYILRHATEKSLIIMDEIGRGTSTYDGISIAWSVAEYLVKNCHENGPKTLFATHYHELQTLADECADKIRNYHMAITQHEGKPVFLYKLEEGGASHSFGVAVAQLAGVPDEVVRRAEQLLSELEAANTKLDQAHAANAGAAPLPTQPLSPTHQHIIDVLQKLSIDQMTPLESLNTLAQLKKEISYDK